MSDQMMKKADGLIAQIESAIVNIRQNKMINVGSLEKEVTLFCQQVLGGPAATARTMEPRMVDMINKLDEFARELEDYKQRMENHGSH